MDEELKEGLIRRKKNEEMVQLSELKTGNKKDKPVINDEIIKPIGVNEINEAKMIINQKYPLNFLRPDQALIILKPFKWLCK